MSDVVWLNEIRKRNERVKAEIPVLIQPERSIIQTAADIDALLAEVERLSGQCCVAEGWAQRNKITEEEGCERHGPLTP